MAEQQLTHSGRGSGRTTKQMKEAPRNAIFIWVNGHLDYPRKLAHSLSRDDLKIVSPEWLADERWRGLRRPVVVDHYATFSVDALESLYRWQAYNAAHGITDG